MSEPQDKVRRVLTVVYIGMIASVGVYAGMLPFLPSVGKEPLRPTVVWILLATGAGEYLLATLAGRRILSARRREAVERVRSFFLIRFAAAEAIAIFGLAVAFLGTPRFQAMLFFAASVAAFLFAYPGRDAFAEALARAQGSEKPGP